MPLYFDKIRFCPADVWVFKTWPLFNQKVSCISLAGWVEGTFTASKLLNSVSISLPLSTVKPIEINTCSISCCNTVLGCNEPMPVSTGKVISINLALLSSACNFSSANFSCILLIPFSIAVLTELTSIPISRFCSFATSFSIGITWVIKPFFPINFSFRFSNCSLFFICLISVSNNFFISSSFCFIFISFFIIMLCKAIFFPIIESGNSVSQQPFHL